MLDQGFKMERLLYLGAAIPGWVAVSMNAMKGSTSIGAAITVSVRDKPLTLFIMLGKVVPLERMMWAWHGRLGLVALVSGRTTSDPAHDWRSHGHSV